MNTLRTLSIVTALAVVPISASLAASAPLRRAELYAKRWTACKTSGQFYRTGKERIVNTRILAPKISTWAVALLIAGPAFAGGDDAVTARAKLALVEGQLRDAERYRERPATVHSGHGAACESFCVSSNLRVHPWEPTSDSHVGSHEGEMHL